MKSYLASYVTDLLAPRWACVSLIDVVVTIGVLGACLLMLDAALPSLGLGALSSAISTR